MPDDRQRQGEERWAAREAALSLERRGLLEPAVHAYISAGAPEEAARLLVQQRKFAEAGRLLLDTLGVPPDAAGTLDPSRRKVALQAAVCLGRAGDTLNAATLFAALGERERAAEVLRRGGDKVAADRVLSGGPVVLIGASSGAGQAQMLERTGNLDAAMQAYVKLRQPQDAARMAVKLGRFQQAADFFTQAGLHYEAAESFWRANDPKSSLKSLLHVSREDPRYRQCCLLVIRIAADQNVLDLQVDHFLTKFLTDAPRNDQEVEAFYRAAALYQQHEHIENARDAYRRLLAVSPNFRDSRARLEAISTESRSSAMVFEKILKEEESFRRPVSGPRATAGSPVTLADLPDLPDLPPVSIRANTADRTAVSSATTPKVAPVPVSESATLPSATVSADVLFSLGSLLVNRYRIEARIGQGGMASVFRAHDVELNERIAMKVFTQQIDDEQLVGRFKQELTLSRQLQHPNIIRLYDIGSVQGFRYLTMELLTGTDLRSRLGRPIDIKTGVGYLLQVCAALRHVHERGVVHRDIKPANLFLTDEGVVKLMDFGIAKRQATPGLTVAGTLAGTPEYMSPEQINGFDTVTASTDIYAVGIMAYEIFTGAVPFRHKELMPLLVMHMQEKPVSPRLKNPAIPPLLETIILKLLEKDPAQRFNSCAELSMALHQI